MGGRGDIMPTSDEDTEAPATHTAEHIRAAVPVTARTGLRQGEIFDLSVDRIDLFRREARIDRQLWTPPSGRPVLKAPKSANSHRTVALGSLVANSLAAHVGAFGPGENGLVFHMPAGQSPGPCRRSTCAGRPGQRASRAATAGTTCATTTPACSCRRVSARPLVAERLGHDVKSLQDWLRTAAV